jgi:galactose mutarotase-like enzyme
VSGEPPRDPIRLRAGDAVAEIARRGAELRRLRLNGFELIRESDDIWPATSPILFPIVGWACDGSIRVDGKTYPMAVHGFAAAQLFELESAADDSLTLCLRDDAATRACFPFGFDLRLTYRLGMQSLSIELCVGNSGDRALPYACGLHPGFRWPFAGGAPEDYAIRFQKAEQGSVPVIAPGGLFSTERRAVPLDRDRLPLTPGLMAQEALCFLDVASQSLSFEKVGGPSLQIELDSFPHVALWSRPPSPFLCIEAWTGHGDPVGYTGELKDKPSVRLLMPGARARHGMTIRFAA